MTKRQLLWILVYSFLMVFATIAASCTGSESDKAPVQATVSPVRHLYQIKIQMVSMDTIACLDTLYEEHYCYARDKYDADRLFNDSVPTLKDPMMENCSITEVKAFHWQR